MTTWLTESPLVLEVVPPPLRLGDAAVERILARVQRIHEAVRLDAVNIPEIREEESKSDKGVRRNPYEPRVEPRKLASRVQLECKVPTIVNRVVVHLPEPAQAMWFRETHEEYGVSNFVLVGGEREPEHYPGPSVGRANELVRETLRNAHLEIGNICIPGRRLPEFDEPERMAAKAANGTDFFSTQIVYHTREFTRLLDDNAALSDDLSRVPILLSVCPLKSVKSVDFLRFLGVGLDEELVADLSADPDNILARSSEHIVEMWNQIRLHIDQRGLATPVGLNLAPIGAIPIEATIELAQRLRVPVPG